MSHPFEPYISLFEQERKSLDRASVPSLSALRPAALAALRRFAGAKTDGMLAEALAPDYGLNLRRRAMPIDPSRSFGCDVPRLGSAPCYTLNDIVHCPGSAALPAGVTVTAMSQATGAAAESLCRYVGTLADPVADPVVALNTLLAQDGLLVHVAEGVVVERPLQLVNILNSTVPLMAVRRVLVVAESGARVQLLVCDHTQTTAAPVLSCEVVEVAVGADAGVDIYDLEESNASTRRLCAFCSRQQADSRLLVTACTLSGGTTRNSYRLDADERGADTRLLGMVIAGGTQRVATTTLLRHRAPDCHSNEMFKYVLQDEAVGSFDGRILVSPQCPGVEAYQGNRNLLASPHARMSTRPELEIYTDDVKCGHGSTIGQLDEEALFYMRTRGVPLEQARTLLMQAFMADVVDAVRHEPLRHRLRHLVDRRFAGELASCATCAAADCHHNDNPHP